MRARSESRVGAAFSTGKKNYDEEQVEAPPTIADDAARDAQSDAAAAAAA